MLLFVSLAINQSEINWHTGALGLMITLGGRAPCLFGVPGAPALGEPPPIALNLSGAT